MSQASSHHKPQSPQLKSDNISSKETCIFVLHHPSHYCASILFFSKCHWQNKLTFVADWPSGGWPHSSEWTGLQLLCCSLFRHSHSKQNKLNPFIDQLGTHAVREGTSLLNYLWHWAHFSVSICLFIFFLLSYPSTYLSTCLTLFVSSDPSTSALATFS